jgi:phospholipid N-methyltransferase
MDTIVYLKSMIRDKNVASITPTSSFGIEKVCSKINFKKRNVIVEYGPGTGVFTKYLLDHMTADSKLILIERNNDFIKILRQSFQDRRLAVYHDSAENVAELLAKSGENKADYVISGIPFSFLPQELRDTVVERSYACLCEGGKFLAYQTFYQLDRFLKVYLNKYFPLVYTSYCLRNAPPLRIFEAVK